MYDLSKLERIPANRIESEDTLLDEIVAKNIPVVITQDGQDSAVLIPWDFYNKEIVPYLPEELNLSFKDLTE